MSDGLMTFFRCGLRFGDFFSGVVEGFESPFFRGAAVLRRAFGRTLFWHNAGSSWKGPCAWALFFPGRAGFRNGRFGTDPSSLPAAGRSSRTAGLFCDRDLSLFFSPRAGSGPSWTRRPPHGSAFFFLPQGLGRVPPKKGRLSPSGEPFSSFSSGARRLSSPPRASSDSRRPFSFSPQGAFFWPSSSANGAPLFCQRAAPHTFFLSSHNARAALVGSPSATTRVSSARSRQPRLIFSCGHKREALIRLPSTKHRPTLLATERDPPLLSFPPPGARGGALSATNDPRFFWGLHPTLLSFLHNTARAGRHPPSPKHRAVPSAQATTTSFLSTDVPKRPRAAALPRKLRAAVLKKAHHAFLRFPTTSRGLVGLLLAARPYYPQQHPPLLLRVATNHSAVCTLHSNRGGAPLTD